MDNRSKKTFYVFNVYFVTVFIKTSKFQTRNTFRRLWWCCTVKPLHTRLCT